ncbi:flagellar protein FlaG [Paenibacillus agaridevorans]|uniref:flagellar protein FlaG n=1 Tax=Paenibacillus agaridevorans TaxID=171404 RepID=UPI002159E938|nr:flagellar protein FlaG [Paenibacillus agaridevorans]
MYINFNNLWGDNVSIQISSMSSMSARRTTAEHNYYESMPRQKEQSEIPHSATELKKIEQTGAKLSVGDEQMVKMVDRAIKALQGPHTNAQLSIHEPTNTVMIKIINSDTGELIREIPPEKTLDIVAKLIEVNGLLFDTRV